MAERIRPRVRRSCERGGKLAESFGMDPGVALLTRSRVEQPAAPDQARSGCPHRSAAAIGQPRAGLGAGQGAQAAAPAHR